MTNLTVFNFENNQVRVIEIDGNFWFVAKDVCSTLEVNNVSQALSRLDEDEKNTIILNDGTPGNPNIAVVSESGLYSLVLSSRKPEAKAFKKWVTSEVLPSIRKTGSYMNSNMQLEMYEMIKAQQEALNKLTAEKTEKEVFGDLITQNYQGISELLKSVLEGVFVQYREVLQTLYSKRDYYTLQELSQNLFGKESFRIYCRARCNINGLYQTMTKKVLPKDRMRYIFDNNTSVFAVWRLHYAALDLGVIDKSSYSEYEEVIKELNSLL